MLGVRLSSEAGADLEDLPMQATICVAAELVQVTHDIPYSCEGESESIPGVT